MSGFICQVTGPKGSGKSTFIKQVQGEAKEVSYWVQAPAWLTPEKVTFSLVEGEVKDAHCQIYLVKGSELAEGKGLPDRASLDAQGTALKPIVFLATMIDLVEWDHVMDTKIGLQWAGWRPKYYIMKYSSVSYHNQGNPLLYLLQQLLEALELSYVKTPSTS